MSRYVCTACIRGLRRQVAEIQPHPRYIPTRSISTSLPRRHKTTAPAKPTHTHDHQHEHEHVSPKAGTVKKGLSPSLKQYVGQAIRYTAPSLAEPYIAYGATEILVRECARVADYTISEEQRMVSDEEGAVQIGEGHSWWYEELGLQPCFNTWAQITFLHMWMLTVRIRTFPEKNAPTWHQQLVDHFFYLAEEKMVISHNIASRSIRNGYLKDLFIQWRGLTLGYDQGMIESDAVLAAAIWRNVCGSKEDVNLVGLTHATSYVRSVLQGLERMDVQDIASGQITFEDPSSEKDLVALKSRMWTQPVETDSAPAIKVQDNETVTPAANHNAEKATPARAPAAPTRPTKFRKEPARPASIKGTGSKK